MPINGELDGRGSLGTVRNAVTLLELLADGPAYHALTDLAERSGLSVPTTHRLLRSLVLADLVEQDPRSSRYGLGCELVRLSHRYLARLPVVGALSPFLVPLRAEVSSTVRVLVLVRGSLVEVDRVDGSDEGPFRDPHRLRSPLACASGRLLVARADDEQWKLAWEVAPVALRAEADAHRDEWAGAASLVGPLEESVARLEVAVPVLDAGGIALASLSASVPAGAGEAQVAAVTAALSRTATVASRTLGNG